MSYNPTDIEVKVFNWLQGLTTDLVIYSDQRGPRPTDDTYLTVKVLTDSPIQAKVSLYYRDDNGQGTNPDDLTIRIEQERQCTLSIQAYGPGAYGALRAIQLKARIPRDHGVKDPIALRGLDTIQRLWSDTAPTAIESRAVWGPSIGYRVQEDFPDYPAVRRVIATLEVSNPDIVVINESFVVDL